MDLKGGIGYLNVRNNDILSSIEPENSKYVDGLYKDAINIVRAKKICVIYNAGTYLSNVPILVTGYNVASGVIMMRIIAITSTGSVVNRRLCVKSDSTYYILAS